MGADRPRTRRGLDSTATRGARADGRHRSGRLFGLLIGELDQHLAHFPSATVAALVNGDDVACCQAKLASDSVD